MQATVELDGVVYEVEAKRTATGWSVVVDGHQIPVRLERNGSGMRLEAASRSLHVELGPGSCRIDGQPRAWRILNVASAGNASGGTSGHGAKVRPPMNGKLERILVKPGQAVAKGEVLFVLEAMKMQNEVRSPVAGRIGAVHGVAGSAVEPSQVVVEIEPA